METLSQLKEDYFRAIRSTKALLIREEAFSLRSGGTSHIYLSHNNFLSHYDYIELLAKIYQYLIEENVMQDYHLCAVDSIMSPVIVGAYSVMVKKDIVVCKEEPLTHGTKQKCYGDVKNTFEFVILDDMTSTGSTIITAINVLREGGAIVKYAIVSAVRDNVPREKVSALGCNLLYIASFEEIIKNVWGELSSQEREIVSKELRLGN